MNTLKVRMVLIGLLSVIVLQGRGQEAKLLTDTDFDGRIKSERSFSKESLFGYMNGGAELYLEYGFYKLDVLEINADGSDLKVEIYHMNDLIAAFGIYSVSFFKCDESNDLKPYSCHSKYQLQMCKGRYYISIVNTSGTEEGTEASRKIAQLMSDRITGKTFNYSKIISGRTGNKELNRVQLFKGRTSLSNNAWDWNEILGEADFDYCLLLESDEEVQLFVLLKDNTLKGELIESLPEDIDNEEYNSFIILRKQLN